MTYPERRAVVNGERDVRCGECGRAYRYERDMLSGDYMWVRGRGCRHPFECVLIDGKPPDSVNRKGPRS